MKRTSISFGRSGPALHSNFCERIVLDCWNDNKNFLFDQVYRTKNRFSSARNKLLQTGENSTFVADVLEPNQE
ncbi:hypothetical protein GS399_08545 [Pedobacter sp. HMF7647]|uniref:Uncharacterized protein n=1 Tax=Hufsiella arboris TaxID=2695275 RepID=A0A7K1YA65_9SPHI|nr:hypothetical protein [Hufsiella arboris]MXV51019.1 hypothetical protein [Hufsiella arboris]